ncbi:hypothetical protein [Novosphingobium sp.]|uniref:hypothetical protein n=1 Tax=Novosphingobium sp. TaxID=1874826 RepID=UPI003D114297
MSEVTVSIDGADPKTARSSAIVQFYDGRDYMNELDRRVAIDEGRMSAEDPDYRVIPFVKIKFPGRNDLVIDRAAITETIGENVGDHERFPREWAAYRAQDKQDAIGTPLSEIAAFNDGDIAMLAEKHIRSVETLASLPDSNLNSLGMGMRRYRDIARNHLDAQPKALDPQTQNEMDVMRERIAQLEALITAPKQKEKAHAVAQ